MSPDDVDLLISQLGASLPPPQYSAFIAAARSALAGIPCLGPGLAYRILADVQKRYFDAPPDNRAVAGPRHHGRRPSKLIAGPALGRDDPRAGGRERRRLKLKLVG